jgi:hypothetical protein
MARCLPQSPVRPPVSRSTPDLLLGSHLGRASVSPAWDLVRFFLHFDRKQDPCPLLGVLSFVLLACAPPCQTQDATSPLEGFHGSDFLTLLPKDVPHQRQSAVPPLRVICQSYPAPWSTFPRFVSAPSRPGAVVRRCSLPFFSSRCRTNSRWKRPGIVDRYDLPQISPCFWLLDRLARLLTKTATPRTRASGRLPPFLLLPCRIHRWCCASFSRCLVADHHRLASRGKCRLHIHSLVLLLDESSSRLSFRWASFAGSAGSDSESSHTRSWFSIDYLIAGLLGTGFGHRLPIGGPGKQPSIRDQNLARGFGGEKLEG